MHRPHGKANNPHRYCNRAHGETHICHEDGHSRHHRQNRRPKHDHCQIHRWDSENTCDCECYCDKGNRYALTRPGVTREKVWIDQTPRRYTGATLAQRQKHARGHDSARDIHPEEQQESYENERREAAAAVRQRSKEKIKKKMLKEARTFTPPVPRPISEDEKARAQKNTEELFKERAYKLTREWQLSIQKEVEEEEREKKEKEKEEYKKEYTR